MNDYSLDTLKSKIAIQEDLKNQWAQKQEEFRIANLELYNRLLSINIDIAQYEEGMKDYMLNTFKEDGSKAFNCGCIKMFKEYEYSESDAFNWAIEKNLCLTLDKKAFEKLVEPLAIGFVKVNTIPKAMISRKMIE